MIPTSLAASKALAAAQQSLALLGTAQSLDEMERYWLAFVESIEKGWTKLELACPKTGSAPTNWKQKRMKQRKNDPLLLYLRHARNVDQHTLESTVTMYGPRIGLGLRPGATQGYVESFYIAPNGLPGPLIGSSEVRVSFEPAQVRLRPVTDRGTTYAVPTSHLGISLSSILPQHVGPLALRYYEDALAELNSILAAPQ
ncbi:MAG: hypothetical protein IPF98_10185 [Gemmatimonadetes bacterium]|nr:hypothetical protein [Gemmatimonadota bacterium]